MSRVNLVGLLPSELEALAVELGASRYRGRQLATWIYRKGVFDLEAMTDLPKDFRARLTERAVIEVPEPERVTASQDGSRKLVFLLGDGSRVSSVLMPDDDRMTLCVSTQVGCGFECRFCLTGVMGLERSLGPAEILGQVLLSWHNIAFFQALTAAMREAISESRFEAFRRDFAARQNPGQVSSS